MADGFQSTLHQQQVTPPTHRASSSQDQPSSFRDSTAAPDSEASPFETLGDEELCWIMQYALRVMQQRGMSLPQEIALPPSTRALAVAMPLPPAPPPEIYKNARFEKVACAGLDSKYDGSPDALIPTLNLIHLRRQNKVWCTATYHVQDGISIDMIRQFSKVSLSSVQSTAAQLWDDPQSHIHRHMRGTKAYCSRLFGLFLLNSLTPMFATTLHSRIDQKYSSDGPLLLVTMCNHVHRNHLAFVESVKHKLCTITLQSQ
jgi:hypothetical protein